MTKNRNFGPNLSHFKNPAPIRIRTHNLMIMSRVLYHCAVLQKHDSTIEAKKLFANVSRSIRFSFILFLPI